ncbi:CBM35 domain-containing protein [Gaetbulibacter saemankumensis]|uniref:CBM35 domain-containing protein n=1 Tax=Gaetbulibacter saemankumensis TaxID=311208 RepID=UPI00047FAC5A|nr:CBM35 domain-containing protein [Gaetbulibacter saemankumensis]
MKTNYFSLIASFQFLLLTINSVYAQINVDVNTNAVIASGVSNKYGINLNAAADHDDDRTVGAQSLATAMTEIGAKRIRYPGGKKSLFYAWTADPLNPDPTTHHWVGWAANTAARTSNDLNFDEFMAVCIESGAQPHVNVAYHKNPDYQDLLDEELAAAWVKYANITKGYNVKYWEIGNEMWNAGNFGTSGKIENVQELASIVISYSNAMKAIDPTIKIGVSWHTNEFQTLIDLCGSALDFVTISNYKSGGGSSYSDYKNANNRDLLSEFNSIPLNTVVSEYNHADWSNSTWDLANCAGKGIINFDMTGQILKSAKTEYGMFWNTRYYPNSSGVYTEDKFQALDNYNNLLPVAQPFILWKRFIKDELVQISSDNYAVVAYAAYDDATRDLNVFLINKETSSKNISLSINSGNVYVSDEVWQYKGNDEWDTTPTLGKIGDIYINNNTISNYSLPSTSITVFKLVAGSIAYEAEKATLIGDASIIDCDLASGGKQVNKINATSGVLFTVNADVTANHKVTFSYNSITDRNITYEVNGGTPVTIAILANGTSWCPGGVAPSGYTITVPLNAGSNTIKFSKAPVLDKIYVELGNTYEAENATLTGDANIIDCNLASGGKQVNKINATSGVLFNVSAEAAADYTVTVGYNALNDREMTYEVNGGTPVTVAIPASGSSWCPSGGFPADYTFTVPLAAGSNTIKFYDSPVLDRIYVEQVSTAVQTDVYEAENATLIGEANIINCDIASGGKEVNNISSSTSGVLFDVTAGSDAAYDVTVSYNALINRELTYEVNGGTPVIAAIPASGSTWCPGGGVPAGYTFTVQLTSGNNTIKFYDSPVLDKIEVTASSGQGSKQLEGKKRLTTSTTEEVQLKVYPNPIRKGEVLKILLPEGYGNVGDIHVSIMDLTGRMVSEAFKVSSGTMEVPTKGIKASGIYLLKINSGSDVFVKKLLVE